MRRSVCWLFRAAALVLLVAAAPLDLERWRAGPPHPRAVAVKPMADPKALATALTKDVKDPVERARILHDWTPLNLRYDWASFLSGSPTPSQGPADVLTSGKAVCDGYAGVFVELCGHAGLECAKVSGYARGYEREQGKPENPADEDHAWNAVKLGGAWHLLDPTWDSPDREDAPRDPKRRFGTEYFLLDPRFMLFTHFPKDPKWQLLPQPVAPADFLKLPKLTGEFLSLTRATIDGVDFTQAFDRELSFFVPHPDAVHLTARLERAPQGRDFVGLRRERGGTRVLVAAPAGGDWMLKLFAHRGEVFGASTFRLTAKAGAGHGYASLSPDLIAMTRAPPEQHVISDAAVEGKMSFVVPHPPDVSLTVALEPQGDAAQRRSAALSSPVRVEQWALLVPEKNGTRVLLSFPEPGPFKVSVWAERAGSKTWAVLMLRADTAARAGYLNLDRRLVAAAGAPLEGAVLSNRVGRELSLSFKPPPGIELSADATREGSADWLRAGAVTAASGTVAVRFTFPEPGAYLCSIWWRKTGSKEWQSATAALVQSEFQR